MAERGNLQNVDVTVRGVKTTFRVRPDQAAKFKAMGDRAGGGGGSSGGDADHKARRTVSSSADVKNKGGDSPQ